jgi:hypothetical protein
MDNEDVFSLFEKNVPYELRLRDALLNDLVVPFKYYGIKDNFVDYSEEDISKLVKDISKNLRVKFIIDNIEKLGYEGNKLRAIGFCQNIEHARLMSEEFSKYGYNTTYLTGFNNTKERMEAFDQLENKELQIIFTVDILNEGVDLPSINTVLFLRPTDSSTIFIQQLGRGLRKYPNKNYLTVLDFIGNNYKRGVQIALALGSLSENIYTDKQFLMECIRHDYTNIGLPIEIHMDESSKEEILNQIEHTNFNNAIFLKQDYENFKKYLNGVSPKHVDFLNVDIAPNIDRFIKKHKSYYDFLQKVEEDLPTFNSDEVIFIRYLSSFIPLVRPYEYEIVKVLMEVEKTDYTHLKEKVSSDLIEFNEGQFYHALNHLQNAFYSENERQYMNQYVKVENNFYYLDININNKAFVEYLNDLIEYGLERLKREDYEGNEELKLYKTYTREQFLQAICCNTMTFREGIKFYNNETYLFIDLKKDASKEEWLLYKDKFLSDKILQWESSTETTLINTKGINLRKNKNVHIFIRKIKSEDGIILPYIYIGKGELTTGRPSDNPKESLLFNIVLHDSVPDYLKLDFDIKGDYNIYSLSTIFENGQRDKLSKKDGSINMNMQNESENTNANFKIGKFVNTVLRNILTENKLSQDELLNIQNRDYSKRKFNINYPLLVKEGESFEKLRYYKDSVLIGGKRFYLCSQWFSYSTNLVKMWVEAHK